MPIVANHLTIALRQEHPLLADVSLEINDGEFVLVLGTSGSGKSIFGMCLNGIIPQVIPVYYSGSLTVNGLNPQTTPISEMATQVGLVFQDPDAQLVAMHVEDEIVFGPENLLMEREETGRRLKQTLDLVGMWSFKDLHTWSLSGGQKQRVAIGSVLAMQPSILMLDEPTSNLDPAGTRAVLSLLVQLHRQAHLTVIAIEHKVDELIEQVDRLLVFDQGRLIANDHPREVIARHGEMLMRKGVNLPQVAEVGLLAKRRGARLPANWIPLTVDEAAQALPRPPVPAPPAPTPKATNSTGPAEMRFDAVTFSYPYRPPALRDVNLNIYPGELIAVVGQNGAGKTTLTKLMVGLLKTTRGQVTFRDENVARMPLERLTEKVGYVFQYPDNQLVTDTVFDEVAFSMHIRRYPEARVKAKVDEVLSLMELTPHQRRHPLTLSMGEKRRLSVATMLVLDQDILILDEPTMGMDWGHVVTIMNICRKLQAQGRTIVMVTHDMRVVANWASRVVAMADGEIVLDDSPRTFFIDEALLQRTSLSQLPLCRWRQCQTDNQARCATCTEDFLHKLVGTSELVSEGAN